MVGRKIGQFQIVEELGVGGMGTVYKARDTRLNRYVAIKALHPHVLRDSQAYRRFKNEAQISAQLSNPNVATLYDFIKEKDQSYLIMEYIDGVTIEERLKREGALSAGETINLAKQILRGLAEAHRLNILHRDLKPANVMIKAGNYAKLMDFGIARLETATRLTANNKVIGTVEYMAPELLKGKEPSKASDLYAVGVMIYEMLTGKTLFVANSEAALVYSIVNEKPKFNLSGVPPELRRIVKKLTSKLPQNRYWDTKKVLKDLEKITLGSNDRKRPLVSLPDLSLKWPAGISIRKASSSWGEKLTRWGGQWSGNKKTQLVLLSSIILSLFIVLVGSFLPSGTAKNPAYPAGTSPTSQLDNSGQFVPDEPVYQEADVRRTVRNTPLPEQPSYINLPPVTIEKKAVEPQSPSPQRKTTKPASPKRAPSTPVDIAGNSSSNVSPEKTSAVSIESYDDAPATSQGEAAEQVREETIISEKETIEETSPPLAKGEEVRVYLPQQYLAVVFGRDVSSADLQPGQEVYLKADSKVVVDGATVIAKGARVRAKIKTNTVKRNGKTEFSLAIDAVESTAKKWISLVYPEYSLIQKGEVLFPAKTRLSRVKIKPQSTIIFE